jgi:hypothetical protein
MRRPSLATAACAVVTLLVCPSIVRAAEPEAGSTHMTPDRAVRCLVDGQERVWRVQCTDPDAPGKKICLFALDHELDEDGAPTRVLERARPCDASGSFDQDALRAQGYALVPAVADAPHGWMRDERGRVFQVTFDLHKRLYAGVSWAPVFHDADGEAAAGRTSFDFGLFAYEHTTGDRRTGFRHRVRLVEGSVQLAPFGAEAVLAHYDFSRRSVIPLVRLTTFWGTPRRHDIAAHMGGWFELGHLQVDELADGRTETLWRYATAHLTWDLWRSPDMSSFVRFRGGAGLERAVVEKDADGAPGTNLDRDAVTPAGAAEADLTLDDDGFHHVTLMAQLERPIFSGEARDLRTSAKRAQLRAAYEVILVAVNDQPVTLRFAGEALYRDDIPGVAAGWDLRATAGVRLSLWAPAR